MKHILKKQEPNNFTQWKESKAYLTDIKEKYKRFKQTKKIREAVKTSLLEEQGFICCYCERRIDLNSSHIEHLIPRDHDNSLSLEYTNLLGSCQRQKESEDIEPSQCGNAKGNQIIPIHPLQVNCASRFIYTDDGRILEGEDDDVDRTVKALNLNLGDLVEARAKILEIFNDEDLTIDDLSDLILRYLEQRNDDSFSAFWSMIYSKYSEFIAS